MNVEDTPSVWRLLWSPRAMAWWARYRTLTTLRAGTAVVGVWFGLFAGWMIHANDAFGQPALDTLVSSLITSTVVFGVLHGWTWFYHVTPQNHCSSCVLASVSIAALPACLFDLPDAILSLYRDATYFATFGQGNPVWPPLPPAVEALTQTCMWIFIALCLWVYFGVSTLHRLRQLSWPDATRYCPKCQYDLRGTLDAGIKRCPECGAAVDDVEAESVADAGNKN